MVSDDIDMFFMLFLLSLDAFGQDFRFSWQVIEYLHIDEGIEFHSDLIHHRISNIIDLVKDDFYALFGQLSAFKDFSGLVSDLKLSHSIHQLT